MAENDNRDQIAESLRLEWAKQDELRNRFEAARQANSYKDEIGLDDKYKLITEFRVDTTAIMVKHLPTTLLTQWEVMTGRRSLKRGVESWVDGIHEVYPPKT